MAERIAVTYRVRSTPDAIAARARTIAVEQSVEMPVEAITDATIRRDVVGEVQEIAPVDDASDLFDVRIGLAAATIGADAGQLLNMLFGNTSLHDDVVLHDIAVTPALAASFGGPTHGIAGLRDRVGAAGRALACSAIKPQGMPPAALAEIAGQMALGGLDYIKDDHGLAAQEAAPFAARVRACVEAVRHATARTGRPTRYVPSLSGSLDALRAQARIAQDEGLDSVLVAPMIAGWSNVQVLRREFPELALFAHPSMGGTRIRPALLIGTLFRLLGADAVIYPHHGGRFGYSLRECAAVAQAARTPISGIAPAMPVPAGGMTVARVAEILDFYGPDVMLLIGGSLLAAGDRLTEATADFAEAVADHRYGD
jgi:ribulose-bisphosphate carboxylase large chain